MIVSKNRHFTLHYLPSFSKHKLTLLSKCCVFKVCQYIMKDSILNAIMFSNDACRVKFDLFACWINFHDFCRLLIFVQNLRSFFLKKNSFRSTISLSNCLCQIRPNALSGQIWVKAFCKGHQPTTKFATSRQRVKTTNLQLIVVRFQNGNPVVYGGFVGYSAPAK